MNCVFPHSCTGGGGAADFAHRGRAVCSDQLHERALHFLLGRRRRRCHRCAGDAWKRRALAADGCSNRGLAGCCCCVKACALCQPSFRWIYGGGATAQHEYVTTGPYQTAHAYYCSYASCSLAESARRGAPCCRACSAAQAQQRAQRHAAARENAGCGDNAPPFRATTSTVAMETTLGIAAARDGEAAGESGCTLWPATPGQTKQKRLSQKENH